MPGYGLARYLNEHDRVIDSWRLGQLTFRECSRRAGDLWITHLVWCAEQGIFGNGWRPARTRKRAKVYRFPAARTVGTHAVPAAGEGGSCRSGPPSARC